MRQPWCKYLLFYLLACAFAIAQEATRDPQGVTLLTQALNAAGGASVIGSINDFSAIGKITYYWSEPVEGTLKVSGRGLHQFRLDASVAGGQLSWITNGSSAFQKKPDGSKFPLPSQNTVKPATVTFPLVQVLTVVQDGAFNISYVGLVAHDGRQMHDIRVQRTFQHDPVGALSKITKAHIFIDPQSLTIQGIEDVVYAKGGLEEYPHEMQFGSYQAINGVLVPMSITELISGQKVESIELTEIKFNTGLTDADFK